MVKTFKQNNPYNNFLLFVYALVLKFNLLINPIPAYANDQDGFLYKYFLQLTKPLSETISSFYGIISFILLVFQAIVFNRIANKQRMMPKPNYLCGMCFLLVTTLFPAFQSHISALFVSCILLLLWEKLCNLYVAKSPKADLFNIGFFLGLASYIYIPSIAFLIWAFIGLAIIRPFRLTEWVMVLIGLLTPIYLFGAWLFLFDEYKAYQFPDLGFQLPHFTFSYSLLASSIVVGIAFFISIYFLQQNMRKFLINIRKSWSLIYLYLFLAIIIPCIGSNFDFSYWAIAALPASLILSATFFFAKKKWFIVVFHWLMFAIAIMVNYFPKLL